MKSIINKIMPLAVAIACTAGTANAQELKTNVSVRDQFVNNKVPGMVYNTQPAAKSTAVKPHVSTINKMKKEGMPNVPMATGGGSVSKATVAAATAGPLASDKKAEAPAAKKAEVKLPPMQDTELPEIKQPAAPTKVEAKPAQ